MKSAHELIAPIVQCAQRVHEALGPGFVESIYSRALVAEFKSGDFRVEREKLIRIRYGSLLVGKHCLDLVVNEEVILELKACRAIIQAHKAQLRSYLHASEYSCGLILNFGMPELQYELIWNASGTDASIPA